MKFTVITPEITLRGECSDIFYTAETNTVIIEGITTEISDTDHTLHAMRDDNKLTISHVKEIYIK